MIIRIVHHVCKQGRIDEARRYIDATGETLSQAPGFLYRHRAEDPERPNSIASITAWCSQAEFDAFRKGRPAHPPASDPAYPFLSVSHEHYDVGSTIGSMS